MDKQHIRNAVVEKLTNALALDVLERPSSQPTSTVNTALATLNNKALAYRRSFMTAAMGARVMTNSFEEYDYNMAEIVQMEDTESYAAIAFSKHQEICRKSGWHISSSDDSNVKYIKQRLFEISINTGLSMNELWANIQRDIIKYSNCYLILRFDPERTSGNSYMFRGRKYDPIAGIFFADPPSMTVRRDKKGNPEKYRQRIGGSYTDNGSGYTEFMPYEVIHLFANKKEGHAYGTPSCIAVVEDVRSLRRIEEMVEMLISSHIFPLYHYIVGTDNIPGSEEEVENVKLRMEAMPTEGSIITNERHEIKVIGAEGKALDVLPYLDYFEKRVLAGLYISEMTIGRGSSANKSTAQSLDQALIDRCAAINQVIQDQVTNKLFVHLMLDGKKKLIFDTMPELVFNNIDEESVRAKENHALNMYQSNLVSENEARQSIGRAPFDNTGSQGRHVNKVDLLQAEETARIGAKYAPKVTATGAKKPSSAAKNTTKSKARPTNQHGTKATKTKRTANNFLEEIITQDFDHIRNSIGLHIDISSDANFAKTVFITSICGMLANITAEIQDSNPDIDSSHIHKIIIDKAQIELGASIKEAETAIMLKEDHIKVLDQLNILEDKIKDFIITLNNTLE